jgi:hypothetical protein
MSLSSVLTAFTADATAAGLSEESYFTQAIAKGDATVLTAMKAEAVSQSDAQTALDIQDIINSLSSRKQVAIVTVDLSDGLDSGESIDVTDDVINLMPVGSVVTDFSIVAIDPLTGDNDAGIAVGDGVGVDIFMGTPMITDFDVIGDNLSFNYGDSVNSCAYITAVGDGDVGSTKAERKVVVTSNGVGDITGGIVQISFEYIRPLS